MKKIILFSALVAVISSCSSYDAQFCECMKVSKKFNDLSVRLLEKGADAKTAEEHHLLKKQKAKACKDYENMKGEEMLERKAKCEAK
jgi:hypothetical protein